MFSQDEPPVLGLCVFVLKISCYKKLYYYILLCSVKIVKRIFYILKFLHILQWRIRKAIYIYFLNILWFNFYNKFSKLGTCWFVICYVSVETSTSRVKICVMVCMSVLYKLVKYIN